jgi:cell division protein ZipA
MGNWSVILNVLLLAGVVIAIVHTIRSRRVTVRSNYVQPQVNQYNSAPCDDIIAVRKLNRDSSEMPSISAAPKSSSVVNGMCQKPNSTKERPKETVVSSSIMMFLLAKEDRLLAGYELLQTLLSAGLRFGEGHLFHRHQFSNGQGPVLCSVAAATSSGMFDLQNIGAFSVHGLCIFMEASTSPVVDEERFSIMLDTAKQLSEDLDTYLLDDARQPFTDATIARYRRMLKLAPQTNEEFV